MLGLALATINLITKFESPTSCKHYNDTKGDIKLCK